MRPPPGDEVSTVAFAASPNLLSEPPMAVRDWSDEIVVADLADEPALSEDMDLLIGRLEDGSSHGMLGRDIVLNFAEVTYVNSSNISQLLRMRKRVGAGSGRLILCGLGDAVWSVMLVTGLDQVFEFHEDMLTALASLQVDSGSTDD